MTAYKYIGETLQLIHILTHKNRSNPFMGYHELEY